MAKGTSALKTVTDIYDDFCWNVEMYRMDNRYDEIKYKDLKDEFEAFKIIAELTGIRPWRIEAMSKRMKLAFDSLEHIKPPSQNKSPGDVYYDIMETVLEVKFEYDENSPESQNEFRVKVNSIKSECKNYIKSSLFSVLEKRDQDEIIADFKQEVGELQKMLNDKGQKMSNSKPLRSPREDQDKSAKRPNQGTHKVTFWKRPGDVPPNFQAPLPPDLKKNKRITTGPEKK